QSEHGSAIGRYFGGLGNRVQSRICMTQRSLRTRELDPSKHVRRRESRSFLCVIETFLLAAESLCAIAQSIVGNISFWFQLSYSLKVWYGCGIMTLGCLYIGETK